MSPLPLFNSLIPTTLQAFQLMQSVSERSVGP